MKTLVILSYGRESEYRRAILTVLSFWAWYQGKLNDIRTIVFTDNPGYFHSAFAGLPVEYKLLTPAKLTEMLAGKDYIHRRKIAVIDEAFGMYPDNDLLFVDSDTFFFSDPAPLLQSFAPGKSYMHMPECSLAEDVKIYESFAKEEFPKAFIKHIEGKTFSIGKVEAQFNRSQVSWNSGVLGLTKEVANLLPDVFALTDEFFENTKWFVSEQIAFTYVLQTCTAIHRCDQYAYHYWRQKQKALMDYLLEEKITNEFSHLPLSKKMKSIKKATLKWRNKIELEKLQEGSIYAFSHHQPIAGLKYALKAIAKSPFDVKFLKNLLLLSKPLKNEQVEIT